MENNLLGIILNLVEYIKDKNRYIEEIEKEKNKIHMDPNMILDRAKLRELETKINNKDMEINRLNNTIDDLKDHNRILTEDNKNLTNKVEEKRIEIIKLKEELDNYERQN